MLTRDRLGWIGCVTAGVLLAAALTAPPALWSSLTGPPTTSTTKEVGQQAGNRKIVCVDGPLTDLPEFERRLGMEVRCGIAFNDVATKWEDWASPWFLDHPDPAFAWPEWLAADGRRVLVVTQALVPVGIEADWRQRGAAGAYDRHVQTLGENLVAKGLGRVILRLGHEPNDTKYFHGIGDTVADHHAWRRYWARMAGVLRQVPGARFTLDWSVNSAARPIPLDSYYPGDEAVDVVGVDQYDSLPSPTGLRDRYRWNVLVGRPQALRDVVDFARRHRKPLSLPEWGLVRAHVPHGAGDNPHYVDRMAEVIRDNVVCYQGVWHSRNHPDTLRITDAPASWERYRHHFGNDGDSTRPAVGAMSTDGAAKPVCA